MLGIIYRVYFHPLAKYPGPFLAKITNFYGAYYNGIGDLHIQVEKGFKKYGPVIRQGPNKLMFQSETALMSELLDPDRQNQQLTCEQQFTKRSMISKSPKVTPAWFPLPVRGTPSQL